MPPPSNRRFPATRPTSAVAAAASPRAWVSDLLGPAWLPATDRGAGAIQAIIRLTPIIPDRIGDPVIGVRGGTTAIGTGGTATGAIGSFEAQLPAPNRAAA